MSADLFDSHLFAAVPEALRILAGGASHRLPSIPVSTRQERSINHRDQKSARRIFPQPVPENHNIRPGMTGFDGLAV